MTVRARQIGVLALVLLSGCGPLVQIGGNAPVAESLLTITATVNPRSYDGPSRQGDTIGIDLPGVPATLQTLRLPVTTSASEVTYLVGATWAEQPNRQFQRLLADTLAANGTPVIDVRQSNLAPARRLTGSLREFGLDVRDPGQPLVRVRYDAQLTDPRAPQALLLRRFDASEPAADQRPVAVAAALNRAANRVAGDVAAWAAGR
jgi:cholesterol transport system auxiliary component